MYLKIEKATLTNLTTKNIVVEATTSLLVGTTLFIGLGCYSLKASAAGLIQESLFFRQDIPGGGEVSEADFQSFIDNVVTPRFPAGLTVFDANSQYRDNSGRVIQEKSKYLTIFVEDNQQNQSLLKDIAQAYIKQFNQESILRFTNKDINVSFGLGDLFQAPPTNQFIKTDLFFGRNIPNGGEVSETDFQSFLNNYITPLFPDGLTVFNANGQYQNNSKTNIQEKSKNVVLLFEDTQNNESSIYDVVTDYTQQFNQESVLQVADKGVKVSFAIGDVFNEPPTNQFIKTDLFFGRNIAGGGEVSETDFQTFLNNTIIPLFPDGLTVFDAEGQYRNSSGILIKEKSKNASLFFRDTLQNRNSIYNIVSQYTQQFNQESVLQVVDDNIDVELITAPQPVTVPEPGCAKGFIAWIILGSSLVLKKKIIASQRKNKSTGMTGSTSSNVNQLSIF
jgi:hypothetical protein